MLNQYNICPLWFYISKNAFERNRKSASHYLRQYDCETLNLFNEFCDYIAAEYKGKDSSDEFIVLDIIAMSGFYDSASLLIDEPLLEVEKIETGQPTNYLDTSNLIASGTGFSCAGFDQISTRYKTILTGTYGIVVLYILEHQ